MTKKQIVPKVFSNPNSKSTPRHDDLLLILSQNREKYIKEILHHFGHLSAEQQQLFIEPISERKGHYVAHRIWAEATNKDYSGKYRLENFCGYGKEHLQNVNEPGYYIRDDRGNWRKTLGEIRKLNAVPDIKIIKWFPEYTPKNNGYYIGSLDLLVEVQTFIKDLEISPDWIWKGYNRNIECFTIIIEFKPTILSFSETLRQMNVYKSYTETHNIVLPVVYTFNKIDKFEGIFREQKILLRQLKEETDETRPQQCN